MQQDYDFPDYPELTELLHEQSLLGLDSSPDSVNIPIIKFNSQTHKPISLPNNFPVTALAFSNNLIYAALANGDILEYSIDSNLHSQPTKILRLHSDKVTAIVASFSHLYSASIDSKIVIWDLQTGDPVKTIIGHTGPVLSLCLTDQGKLYSGGHDKTINEWDPRSGRRKWILTGSKGAIYALTSSFTCPNTLFSAGEDQVIRAWDTTSGRCVQTFNGHEGPVMALKIKDNLLYSASRDGSVAIWHALDGGLIDTMSSNNNLPITALEIFNNSLFTGSEALSIIQWDLTDRSPIATFSGHTATVTALAVYADKLISTSTDGTIKLWKLDKLSTVAGTYLISNN
ncbi:WD40-repeat-containing domain protein [Globomyces pollinis-pini]|nr:WD40-repeat-containing domain protein [Globomyces pollinis-pini]